MTCKNHPNAVQSLASCSRCKNVFCPNCIAEMGGERLCADCRKDQAAPGKSCRNHPDVIESLVPCSRCKSVFCRDCVIELQGEWLCAACKQEQVKDIQSGADTTQLELASIGKRFCAIFVDGLILAIPTYGILFAVMGAAAFGGGSRGGIGMMVGFPIVAMLLAMAVPVVYEGIMLQTSGQTVGKKAFKIKVVTPEGKDISPGQAWSRAVTRQLISILSWLGILANYLPAFFGKEKKCLHDSVAKTRVIVWR